MVIIAAITNIRHGEGPLFGCAFSRKQHAGDIGVVAYQEKDGCRTLADELGSLIPSEPYVQ